MKKLLLSISFCLFNAATSATVINFDTPTYSSSIDRVEYYVESGVVFSGAFNHADTGIAGTANNGTAFMQYEGFSSLNFGMEDGSLFNLDSIDLSDSGFDYLSPASVTFIAQRSGSVMVSQTFITDGIFGSGNDFETFDFSSDFLGVEYVYIADAYMNKNFAFDNINISTVPQSVVIGTSVVPLPAAIWLFITGLIGLFGFSRR